MVGHESAAKFDAFGPYSFTSGIAWNETLSSLANEQLFNPLGNFRHHQCFRFACVGRRSVEPIPD